MTDTQPSGLAAALAAFQSEDWRAVVGDPGYQVSSLGRVRSLDRVITRRNGVRLTLRGTMLKPQLKRDGHLKVEIGSRTRQVHALVLEAFVGPCPDGMEGCHGDGNPVDNRLANLRWDTRGNNMLDASRHGTHPTGSRTHCPRSHALAHPNLIKSILPDRGCLACNRARARVQWLRSKGLTGDHPAIADAYYVEIMEKVA